MPLVAAPRATYLDLAPAERKAARDLVAAPRVAAESVADARLALARAARRGAAVPAS
jgi:hypothetical protein